ncbi:MAG: class I SAM-dependent methyltransferase [Candidatus Edwardsbacteria bacterium]|nr:class I SAM-dependent methyltransferase [Candidatus Edwardsbacteria bacterium]
MKDVKEVLNKSRECWNGWSRLHHRPGMFTLEGFKAGQSSLMPVEREELGDVSGRSLLQVQCGFGFDALCWARIGARVTGVDFSKRSIEVARALNDELKMDCRFVRSNIYELEQKLEGSFDIAFASYGVLYWVPGLDKWAQVISHFLKPGGTFFIVDEHPVALTYRDDFDAIKRSYFYQDDPMAMLALSQDNGEEKDGSVEDHGWVHPLGDLVSALARHGLSVSSLKEYPFLGYQRFRGMEQKKDGYWHLKDKAGMLPLMFSLKAVKR